MPQVNLRQHPAAQLQLPGFDSGDVDDGHESADDHRELDEIGGGQLALRQRGIGGAKVHLVRANAREAGTRTHGLVRDVDPSGPRIARRPGGIKGRGEGGACAAGNRPSGAVPTSGGDNTHAFRARSAVSICGKCGSTPRQ